MGSGECDSRAGAPMSPHSYEVNLLDDHGDYDWLPVVARRAGDESRCFDAGTAAERWCDANFANLDYPLSIDGLLVRRVDKRDEIETFDVEVRSVPEFTARRARRPASSAQADRQVSAQSGSVQ